MSERMSELLWQAGGYTKLDGSYSLHESHLQKFAELIVAECINMIEAEAKTADEDSVHGMRNAAGLIGRAFNI